MDFEIRAARPGEEERLLTAYEWLFAPPGSRPAAWDPARARVALRQAIDSHDAAVLVAEERADPAAPGREAEEATGIIGICTAYQDLHSVRFGYRAWVEDLAVHPEHRSLGIGLRLLSAARDWARERGATHLELDTAEARADAQRFYERQQPSWRSISYAWEL
jgi:GNAT superfamily N-acetyltransferase